MDSRPVQLVRFEEALSIIRSRHPALRIELSATVPEGVEAAADIPAQPGLDFDVHLNLQNRDELHLCVSGFWAEWFPCGRQPVFDRFVSAVLGLLSGENRVLESFVFGALVAARLQRETVDGIWETVAVSYRGLGFLIPWRRTRRVVQNPRRRR